MVSGAWEHRGWQELEPPSRIKASKIVFNEHQVGTLKSKIKKITQGTTTYLHYTYGYGGTTSSERVRVCPACTRGPAATTPLLSH
jgi:predicted  nucleic acid-binding Zn ribbon protein